MVVARRRACCARPTAARRGRTLCTAPFVGQGFFRLVVDPSNVDRLLAGTTGGLFVLDRRRRHWTQARGRRDLVDLRVGDRRRGWISPGAPTACRRARRRGHVDRGRPARRRRRASTGSPSRSPRPTRRGGVRLGRRQPVAVGARTCGAARERRDRVDRAPTHHPARARGQAWYDWYVAAAPDVDTEVYCGAIHVHRGDLSGGNLHVDRHLEQAERRLDPPRPALDRLRARGRRPPIYVGNDGGVFRSDDRGITWRHCNNGLVISEFEYLAQDIGSLPLAARRHAGQRHEPLTRVRRPGSTSPTATVATARSTAPTPTPCFHTFYGMSPERSTSSPTSGTWASGSAPRHPAGGRGAGLFYPPFERSASGR